ncbi:MAG: tetratricopeptide repeat protein, partial [Abitibacteriaceae bacterium]|nr:tetratricopeptide repeat protein [Abditibacteriaceae bacterium]
HEGKMGEAVALCTKVMKTDPTHAEAPALLGDIYSEQGRNDVALLMYERAMRNQPNNLLYRQKWQAIKNGEVISPPVSQVKVEPPSPPPPPPPVDPPPAAPPSHAVTNGYASAQPPNGTASPSNGTNGAAPPESAAGGNNKSQTVEESAAHPEPSDAEPARGSLVGKLAGWMGKRK